MFELFWYAITDHCAVCCGDLAISMAIIASQDISFSYLKLLFYDFSDHIITRSSCEYYIFQVYKHFFPNGMARFSQIMICMFFYLFFKKFKMLSGQKGILQQGTLH